MSIKSHNLTITCLKVLLDGTLASGSLDTTINIWNVQSGKLVRTPESHTLAVNSIEQLSENHNELLISGSADKTVKIWNSKNGDLLNTVCMPNEIVKLMLLGDYLVIRFLNQSELIVFNAITLKAERRIKCGAYCLTMGLLSDGSLAIGDGRKINILNASSGDVLRIFQGSKSQICCLQLLNDSNLACGSLEGKILILNSTSGQVVHSIKAHHSRVTSMAILSDDSLVSSCGYQQTGFLPAEGFFIKIWNNK